MFRSFVSQGESLFVNHVPQEAAREPTRMYSRRVYKKAFPLANRHSLKPICFSYNIISHFPTQFRFNHVQQKRNSKKTIC